MRFQNVIEQVYFRPWLITEEGWSAVERIVAAHVLDANSLPALHAALDRRAERPTEDLFGDPLPQATVENGIGVIPIHGTITMRASLLAKSCGAVDLLDVREELRAMLGNAEVRAIVLDVASPGGGVSGVAELAEEIAAADKPVVAFAGEMMASAAYWISAGAQKIYAAPSAIIGSIGVFVPWIDQTKAFEARGLKVELIKAGIYKGAGYPGTALTDAQRELVQAGVTATHDEFKAFITSQRSRVKPETMEGQTFSGKSAIAARLVDARADSLDEVIAYLRA